MSGYGKGAERKRRAELVPASRQVAPLPAPLSVPDSLEETGALIWQTFMAERFATITAAEVHVVERYCELQDRRAQLKDLLSVEGWGVPGSRTGMIVIHPAAQMLKATETELRMMESMLGLGPAFRAKLAIDLIAVEDGLDKIERTRRQVSESGGAQDPRLQEPIDAEVADY